MHDKKPMGDRPIQSTHLIVCEGSDEYDLLTMLCKERGWSEKDVEIVDAKGRDKMDSKLADTLVQSGGAGVTHVALVFDSEDDPADARKMANGLVRKHPGLQFQLFQLPSETECGSIETLVRRGISATSPGFSCATQWEACVQADATSAFDLQAKRDKAWLQVWLTHRTTSTASRIGYAVRYDKDKDKRLRREIDAGIQPLNTILDAFVPSTAA